jgi:hypothetical protein
VLPSLALPLKTGDLEVCRNLARMGASICDACHAVSTEARPVKIGPGLLDLLLKAAAHPSTDISGIALEVLQDELSSENGLFHQLLPILQGRAITTHSFVNGDVQSLIPPDDPLDFEGYEAFHLYRETSLTDCLQACWETQPEIYMSSCVSAIEEFSRPQASHHLSFHLEAALFCISAIEQPADKKAPGDMAQYITKCIAAFALKPASLTSNPLTLSQACKFIHKVKTYIFMGWECCATTVISPWSTRDHDISMLPFSPRAKSRERWTCLPTWLYQPSIYALRIFHWKRHVPT